MPSILFNHVQYFQQLSGSLAFLEDFEPNFLKDAYME